MESAMPVFLPCSVKEAVVRLRMDDHEPITHLVSFLDGEVPNEFYKHPEVERLTFHFSDADKFIPGIRCVQAMDVRELIDFVVDARVGGTAEGVWLFACPNGVNLSMAGVLIALIAFYARGVDGQDATKWVTPVIETLYDSHPLVRPNRLMLRHADHLMGLGGTLLSEDSRRRPRMMGIFGSDGLNEILMQTC
jgi:predicted protein tyrosine phosphatase